MTGVQTCALPTYISMTFEGIPGLAEGSAEMNFAGSFTQGLELR